MKKKEYFMDDPEFDKRLRSFWKSLETNNPYKGMTTKEILKKVRHS